LGGDPEESLAEAGPEVVVATAGQGAACVVAQQVIGGQERAAAFGVLGQADGQGRADELPPHRAALLTELNQAGLGVEVGQAQGERAAAAAGGFGVQPEQQRIKYGVVAARAGSGVDLSSSWAVRARRVFGSRRGLTTRWASLAPGGMSPSAMARL
jgi:hypothetical protein